MKHSFLKLAITFLTIFISTYAYAEKVKLATLNWPPYIGEKLKNQGFVAELTKKAFASQGYQVELTYLPWARVVAMAKQGEFDGYLPEYYAESLKNDFIISNPYPGGPLVFFKRKGDNINYTKLQDLKNYRIGVVRGYVNTDEFDNATFLSKDEARDDLTNIKKLIAGRIDLMVADKFAGFHIIDTNYPAAKGKVEVVEPVLEEKDLYLCISRKAPDSANKMKAFNQGLKLIKENGELETIFKKHGF